jgi:hypothetical protein
MHLDSLYLRPHPPPLGPRAEPNGAAFDSLTDPAEFV